MRFGISTHLYHDRRLDREHLAQIAGYGFEAVELFATRSHFDYHDEAAIDALAQWLRDTRLDAAQRARADHRRSSAQATSVGGRRYSNAVADNGARVRRPCRKPRRRCRSRGGIPFDVLVVHLGTPDSQDSAGDNNRGCRDAQRRGDLPAGRAARRPRRPRGDSERALDAGGAGPDARARSRCAASPGICLDFGHAFLGGDVADAVETVAEHLIATHVHDNHRRDDEHLVPYLGSIDWDAALMSMQKIGYDGTYLMELANTSTPAAVLEEARRARQRFERALAMIGRLTACPTADMIAYIEDIARHEGQAVTLRGWLHNRRSSGKIHFLTVRDGTGFIQCVMSKKAVGDEAFTQADHLSQESAIVVDGTVRADARAPGGYEIDVTRLEVVSESQRLPDHAEGARRRLPDGPPPPLDPVAAAAGHPARPARSHQRGPRLLQLARLHPGRHADLHAVGLRGHDDAVPGAVLRATRPPT